MSDNNKTIHKNSLANLMPGWDSESAREAQKKGVEARKANKLAREKLKLNICLLYTSPSPRDRQKSRMPSSA